MCYSTFMHQQIFSTLSQRLLRSLLAITNNIICHLKCTKRAACDFLLTVDINDLILVSSVDPSITMLSSALVTTPSFSTI